jgi:hypothetical protein
MIQDYASYSFANRAARPDGEAYDFLGRSGMSMVSSLASRACGERGGVMSVSSMLSVT